jgi:uncharacterized protein YkwD
VCLNLNMNMNNKIPFTNDEQTELASALPQDRIKLLSEKIFNDINRLRSERNVSKLNPSEELITCAKTLETSISQQSKYNTN